MGWRVKRNDGTVWRMPYAQLNRAELVTLQPVKGNTMNTATAPRTLAAIARDIRTHWKKPYFGAVPYLEAMGTLGGLNDHYGLDDARSIVRYFLANAGTWRGDHARAIKAELKTMIGDK